MKKRIPVAQPALIGNEKKYVNDAIKTNWISSIGKYITKFETVFADFCNVKYALACSNGTGALHLALLSLGIKQGDEVIVPTLNYVTGANAIKYCNATPVFIDSEWETWNLDPTKIEAKITKKTKAIIVVHLYGHPADMTPILKLAKKYNLFIIEDAAEAHGAEYKKKKVGLFGDVGTFSFFGNKIITTGQGGMVVTNNKEIADKVRLLRGQGMDPKRRYWFVDVGYNYRMTNIQAAIGLAQLEKINWHLKRRREVANLYYKYLKKLNKYIELPIEKSWAKHSFWMFTILLRKPLRISRYKFMAELQKVGIETRPIFYPLHILPPYRKKRQINRFPVADDIAKRGVSLPTYAFLTEKEIVFICNKIRDLLQ